MLINIFLTIISYIQILSLIHILIFRMVFSIYGSRKQLIKSMHPITGSKHFVWLFQPVPPFIYGVCTNSITLCLAVTESRIIYFIDKRQFDCLRRVKRVFVFSPVCLLYTSCTPFLVYQIIVQPSHCIQLVSLEILRP